jgi:hypothetical protein
MDFSIGTTKKVRGIKERNHHFGLTGIPLRPIRERRQKPSQAISGDRRVNNQFF